LEEVEDFSGVEKIRIGRERRLRLDRED